MRAGNRGVEEGKPYTITNESTKMENTAEQNIANDYKVVSFHNAESFDFTHEMGCMYDGRPVTGSEGVLGLGGGETKMLPFHVGFRIARNLAKQTLMRKSGDRKQLDTQGHPIVAAIWDDAALENLARSYITEMYSEDKPVAKTQTDVLFERIQALESLIKGQDAKKEEVLVAKESIPAPEEVVLTFQDKQQVLLELEKRGIPHDKRASQAKLEELLT